MSISPHLEDLYADLLWLPRPPEDIMGRINAICAPPSGATDTRCKLRGVQLQEIASSALDLLSLVTLADAIAITRATGADLTPLIPFRLAMLSNVTVDLIVPALVSSCARHLIALEVVTPSYGQAVQDAVTPDSIVNIAKPDAVLFAIDHRIIPHEQSLGNRESAANALKNVIDYFQTLRNGIKANCGALCIFQTLAPPTETLFGSLDRTVPGTMRWLVENINCALAEMALAEGDVLLDVATLAQTVGLARWHDLSLWNMAKLPFSETFIPLYADHVARTLAAIRGKSRKALILDLDDTLWGGTIGDDGLEGIAMAQGDPIGEAHLALQQTTLDLRKRGIVLAICSKNCEALARAPFERHPDMLLKLGDIAAFRANWSEKVVNIQAIADELSLGLDAIVFLDDNPVERDKVRKFLPQVAVPELPKDPTYYARTLAAAGYFESVTFTDDDLRRADLYNNNDCSATPATRMEGVDAYLASLKMTLTFTPFDAVGRARIVQLINKSTQYNLTTRRYTTPEIIEAEKDPAVFTLQVRLADIFGDNGLISVLICRTVGEFEWDIDTWLMSCRVLGRKIEYLVFGELIRNARIAGIRRLIGTYTSTNRNSLVSDHYEKLGFTPSPKGGEGEMWEYTIGYHSELAPLP